MAGRWSVALDGRAVETIQVGFHTEARRKRKYTKRLSASTEKRLADESVYWEQHAYPTPYYDQRDEDARQYIASRFPQGVDAYPVRPIERWEGTPSGARWPVRKDLEDLEEEVVGNRLFAISHREVYDLFKAWGWEDGPVKPDGHHRMVWPKTGQTVQIMPPHRPGTGEKGNAIAMKQARKIMELDSVQRFLDGPVKEKKEQPTVLPEPKEEPTVARVAENSVVGIRKVLASILMERPNHNFHIDDVVLLAREVDPRIDYTKVGGNLSQMSKDAGWPTIVKTGRGFYAHKPQPDPVVELPKPEPTPEPVAVEPEPVDVRPDIPAPLPVSLNGSTPDLLSKVHVLDGGRYLFQGDDGALYVVKDIVRLEV